MKTALTCEWIKLKSSSTLKISLIAPFVFLVYTLLTKLSSQNPNGLTSHVSIIQTSIYNLWPLILMPIMIVLVINSDYSQEEKALGLQHAKMNNWPLDNIYLAKFFKYSFLLLISNFMIFLITVFSNIITTGYSIIWLLVDTTFLMWLASFPLILISMGILKYLNPIVTAIGNILIILVSIFFNSLFYNWFWIDPWLYSMRPETILRINPNGTVLSLNNIYSENLSFIFPLIVVIVIWLIICFIFIKIRFFLEKK